ALLTDFFGRIRNFESVIAFRPQLPIRYFLFRTWLEIHTCLPFPFFLHLSVSIIHRRPTSTKTIAKGAITSRRPPISVQNATLHHKGTSSSTSRGLSHRPNFGFSHRSAIGRMSISPSPVPLPARAVGS